MTAQDIKELAMKSWSDNNMIGDEGEWEYYLKGFEHAINTIKEIEESMVG